MLCCINLLEYSGDYLIFKYCEVYSNTVEINQVVIL